MIAASSPASDHCIVRSSPKLVSLQPVAPKTSDHLHTRSPSSGARPSELPPFKAALLVIDFDIGCRTKLAWNDLTVCTGRKAASASVSKCVNNVASFAKVAVPNS